MGYYSLVWHITLTVTFERYWLVQMPLKLFMQLIFFFYFFLILQPDVEIHYYAATQPEG